MVYDLPTTAEFGGKTFRIRSDFRAILDIIEAINDPDLDDWDRSEVALSIFYPDLDEIPDLQEALAFLMWFIDCGGNEQKKKGRQLIDWERDFERIIAPINRVLGYEARAVPVDEETGQGLHWWTFISAYMEIGPDCLISQVVNIRDKLARGKKLEKHEREWYRRNKSLVDLPTHYSDAEKELEKEWT